MRKLLLTMFRGAASLTPAARNSLIIDTVWAASRGGIRVLGAVGSPVTQRRIACDLLCRHGVAACLPGIARRRIGRSLDTLKVRRKPVERTLEGAYPRVEAPVRAGSLAGQRVARIEPELGARELLLECHDALFQRRPGWLRGRLMQKQGQDRGAARSDRSSHACHRRLSASADSVRGASSRRKGASPEDR